MFEHDESFWDWAGSAVQECEVCGKVGSLFSVGGTAFGTEQEADFLTWNCTLDEDLPPRRHVVCYAHVEALQQKKIDLHPRFNPTRVSG